MRVTRVISGCNSKQVLKKGVTKTSIWHYTGKIFPNLDLDY